MIEFDEKFWLCISFILFVIAVFKPLKKTVINLLDKRTNFIDEELKKARLLITEAEELISFYEKKEKRIAEESNRIKDQAENLAMNIIQEERNKLQMKIKQKRAFIDNLVINNEKEILKNIQFQANEKAFKIIKNIISNNKLMLNGDILNHSISQAFEKLNMHNNL